MDTGETLNIVKDEEKVPPSVDFAKLLRQPSTEVKTRRQRSILVSTPQSRSTATSVNAVSSSDEATMSSYSGAGLGGEGGAAALTVFDEITEEYLQTEDITRFKELMTRPKEIQHYVNLLPAIFSFLQLSVIPADKRYCSENRCAVIHFCLQRLIDYYNVSLSIQFDAQNPIIVFFHDLLDIGQYLIDWLIVSHREEDEETMLELLQIDSIEEYKQLQGLVYQLVHELFLAFKYLKNYEQLGIFKTTKLFRACLTWITLAPLDPQEQFIGFPTDQLLDITFTFPEILYECIWTVFSTFDIVTDFMIPKTLPTTTDRSTTLTDDVQPQIMTNAEINPKPTKAIDCLCDLLSFVYDDCQHDIHQRIDTLLLISDYSFESSSTLLFKIAITDEVFISVFPRGKLLLQKYEANIDEGKWRIRENNLLSPSDASKSAYDFLSTSTEIENVKEIKSTPPDGPPSEANNALPSSTEGQGIWKVCDDDGNTKPPTVAKVREEGAHEEKKKERRRTPRNQSLLPDKLLYDYNPVLFSSHLNKVGSFFPTVKRRWFQLTDDHILRYWRNEQCQEQKGMLRIINIKKVTKLERDNWFEWKTESKIHGGNFRLQCESPELYMKWNEILYRCGVTNIEGYVPSSPPSAIPRSTSKTQEPEANQQN